MEETIDEFYYENSDNLLEFLELYDKLFSVDVGYYQIVEYWVRMSFISSDIVCTNNVTFPVGYHQHSVRNTHLKKYIEYNCVDQELILCDYYQFKTNEIDDIETKSIVTKKVRCEDPHCFFGAVYGNSIKKYPDQKEEKYLVFNEKRDFSDLFRRMIQMNQRITDYSNDAHLLQIEKFNEEMFEWLDVYMEVSMDHKRIQEDNETLIAFIYELQKFEQLSVIWAHFIKKSAINVHSRYKEHDLISIAYQAMDNKRQVKELIKVLPIDGIDRFGLLFEY